MKESALDVLMYLFEHCLDEDRETEQDESTLKGMLRSAGFAQPEINKAFLWLEDLTQQHVDAGSIDIRHSGSLRIFSAPELAKLDRQCRGFLHALEQHKVIDAGTREIVIERAMALELDELTLERFKWIVMMVLANRPDSAHAHIWLETTVFDSQHGYTH
jgi:Smg protein